jgi:hypothetical protein
MDVHMTCGHTVALRRGIAGLVAEGPASAGVRTLPRRDEANDDPRPAARLRHSRVAKHYRKLSPALAILAATAGVSAFATSAQAAVIHDEKVTNVNDSGKGSLRDAINAANSEPTGSIGRIMFDLPTIGGAVPGSPSIVPTIQPTSICRY